MPGLFVWQVFTSNMLSSRILTTACLKNIPGSRENIFAGGHGIDHSPGVSLSTNFHLAGQSLLDESESSSADEEEVLVFIYALLLYLPRLLNQTGWQRDSAAFTNCVNTTFGQLCLQP